LCNLMQSYTMDGSCLTDYAASMKRRTIAVAILFPLAWIIHEHCGLTKLTAFG